MRKTVDELLQMPYWVIDFLPAQVPADSPGQFFAVEKYFLDDGRLAMIKQKHINIILKLNCYMAVSTDDGASWNPSPAQIAAQMRETALSVRIGDALILSESDALHLTVFNPDEKLLKMIREIASGEGMFVWQPPQ